KPAAPSLRRSPRYEDGGIPPSGILSSSTPHLRILIDVPMRDPTTFPFAENPGKMLRDGHRTVFSPRATDPHHQLGFSFPMIMGKEERQKIRQLVDELLGLFPFHHVLVHIRILSGVRAKGFHIVGIGKKTDVEDQIHVDGNPVFESEGK